MKFQISNFKFQIFTFALLCALFFVFSAPARALQISPARQAVVVQPGQVQVVPVTFTNDSEETVLLTPEVDPFTTDPQTGSAVFGAVDIAKSWVRAVPERLQLLPGQEGVFSFTVSVPQGIEERSHYLGLFARSAPAAGQIGVGARLGSLLFLHVGDSAREELVPRIFSVDKKIIFGGPVTVHLGLENTGSIHVIPSGTLSVGNVNYERLVQHNFINADERKVLPGAVWEEVYTEGGFHHISNIGKNTVQAKIFYGATQRELTVQTSFWYIPTSLVVGIVILLVLITMLWVRLKRKKK